MYVRIVNDCDVLAHIAAVLHVRGDHIGKRRRNLLTSETQKKFLSSIMHSSCTEWKHKRKLLGGTSNPANSLGIFSQEKVFPVSIMNLIRDQLILTNIPLAPVLSYIHGT